MTGGSMKSGGPRKCKKCGVEFSGKRCLSCARAYTASWRAANPEKAKENLRNWVVDPERRRATQLSYRERNRELSAAKSAEYRAANPEKSRAAVRRWRAENPDKSKRLAAEYRAENPELNRQRANAWAKLNPEKTRVIQQNRRARKIKSGGSLSPNLAKRLLALQRGRCACCGASLSAGYHLDHITPLVAGGANEDWNIQLLTPRCNSTKASKDPVAFMQSRGFLL
jgi:5-methylcytosine-specific restriction endonuclease McrA